MAESLKSLQTKIASENLMNMVKSKCLLWINWRRIINYILCPASVTWRRMRVLVPEVMTKSVIMKVVITRSKNKAWQLLPMVMIKRVFRFLLMKLMLMMLRI